MGTGTPTVTTSGISAANAVLKQRGLEPFVHRKDQENFVRIVDKPFLAEQFYASAPEPERTVMRQALGCRFCEHPSCTAGEVTDIRGILRRVAVGNFTGAQKLWQKVPASPEKLELFEARCIRAQGVEGPVPIRQIIRHLSGRLKQDSG